MQSLPAHQVTASYAVVMAPRDHDETVAWRQQNPSMYVDSVGCDAAACLNQEM